MKRWRIVFILIALGADIACAQVPESAFDQNPWPQANQGPLQVYILAGQSNMQGHAALRTLEYLIYQQQSAREYGQWKDRWGSWTERGDVWIWTTDGERHGQLKPGFGQNDQKLGPELGFGWVMGEYLDEQVLLIKTCWGGRSVKKDFLPPSAERPSPVVLRQELEQRQKERPATTLQEIESAYGRAYRDMITHTQNVLNNLTQHFPEYQENRGYELAGFVFFQGWNDMVDSSQRQEQYVTYSQRLATLIKDVRRDLRAPALPVVIGELGAGGKRGDFQKAQQAVADRPEFQGTVTCVKTCEFWEPKVEALVNKQVWKGPDWVKFYNVGSERAYHYLGSARIYTRMGKAFAEAMLALQGHAPPNTGTR